MTCGDVPAEVGLRQQRAVAFVGAEHFPETAGRSARVCSNAADATGFAVTPRSYTASAAQATTCGDADQVAHSATAPAVLDGSAAADRRAARRMARGGVWSFRRAAGRCDSPVLRRGGGNIARWG